MSKKPIAIGNYRIALEKNQQVYSEILNSIKLNNPEEF